MMGRATGVTTAGVGLRRSAGQVTGALLLSRRRTACQFQPPIRPVPGLDDIGTQAHAGVEQHRHVPGRRHHTRQAVHGGNSTVRLAALCRTWEIPRSWRGSATLGPGLASGDQGISRIRVAMNQAG
jgi:hypothetical protein